MPQSPSPSRVLFSDRTLKSWRPGPAPRDYRDTQQRGLIARVLPSGAIVFQVRYRVAGKQKRHTLGTYGPDRLTIAKARKAARQALTAVETHGADPASDRQAAKRGTTGDTFDDLAQHYLAKHAKAKKRTWQEDERRLNVDILPYWRTRKVTEITRRDVRALVERIVDRGSPVSATRCLSLVRKILNFGVANDWIEANPAALIEKPAEAASRDRVLTDDEIRRLWRCLSNLPTTAQLPAPFRKRERGRKDDPLCPISPQQADILKLRLLTAQRGGEVARMRWQDLDLSDETIGWWTIPAEHAKNKKAHRVPLVGRALAIITVRKPKNTQLYVFTSGETGAQDRAKKAPTAIARVTGIAFRGHDLRRTAATRMAEAGIPQADIARVLNHAEGGPRATAVYQRYEFDREKRIALDTWDRALSRILASQSADGTVTPITAGRSA